MLEAGSRNEASFTLGKLFVCSFKVFLMIFQSPCLLTSITVSPAVTHPHRNIFLTLRHISPLHCYIICPGQPEPGMMKHQDGIEGPGFPRGPSRIVDNPLSSRTRGKTLAWRAAGVTQHHADQQRRDKTRPGCWWKRQTSGRERGTERWNDGEMRGQCEKKVGIKSPFLKDSPKNVQEKEDWSWKVAPIDHHIQILNNSTDFCLKAFSSLHKKTLTKCVGLISRQNVFVQFFIQDMFSGIHADVKRCFKRVQKTHEKTQDETKVTKWCKRRKCCLRPK